MKLLWAVLLLAAAARAAPFFEDPLIKDDLDERLAIMDTCIAVAANLAPCLAADTAFSALTTLEEAMCCKSLAEFEEAGCFCLGDFSGPSSCAYKKRIQGLASAQERCSWRPVECMNRLEAEDLLVLLEEDLLEEQLQAKQELELSKYITEPEADLEDVNQDGGTREDEQNVLEQPERSHRYLRVTVEHAAQLASMVVSPGNPQASMSFQVTWELVESDDEEFIPQECWRKRLQRAIGQQPVIYGSLAIALVAFVLLCLLKGSEKENDIEASAPKKSKNMGDVVTAPWKVVVAADEAEELRNPLLHRRS